MILRFPLVAALLLASGLAIVPATAPIALADEETAASESDPFSAGQLHAFAKASLKIEDIGREWRPRIAKTTDLREAKKMQNEAVQQMIDAVAAEQLTLEEYNRISLAYNERPALRDRIDKIRKDLR